MIYLGGLELVQGDIYKVQTIHTQPENRYKQGHRHRCIALLVSKANEGQVSILYVNKTRKEAFYEYKDLPPKKNEEVEILKKQVAELSFLVMRLQGGTN